MMIDHETFRMENWEQLKSYRTKMITDYALSETIKD
jgi:hypothetical protein